MHSDGIPVLTVIGKQIFGFQDNYNRLHTMIGGDAGSDWLTVIDAFIGNVLFAPLYVTSV